jgi:hypothetical protein
LGEVCELDVRVLDDADDTAIDEAAGAFAKKHGGEAREGDPQYDRGRALHTLLRACIDKDSPEEAQAPFFDGGLVQVQTLNRDTIAYLLAAQEVWQDQCSPRKLKLSGEEVLQHLVEVATSEDERPFVRLRPGLQWILLRSTAKLALASPELRSLFSSDFAPSSTASPSKAPTGSA